MERLTTEENYCEFSHCSSLLNKTVCECGTCLERELWERLKAYEHTKLTPDEADQIRRAAECMMLKTVGDFVRYSIANFEELQKYRSLSSADHLLRLIEAEKDGRLVVQPCKKGDVLWTFYNYPQKGIYSFCVTATSTLDGVSMLNTDKLGVIPASDVGKTVFLTREKAEAALEARRGESHETNPV